MIPKVVQETTVTQALYPIGRNQQGERIPGYRPSQDSQDSQDSTEFGTESNQAPQTPFNEPPYETGGLTGLWARPRL